MKNSTFLGFDFGTKRIGVAVGQNITKTARALTTLKAKNGTPNWQEIEKLLEEWQPDAVIIGIPVDMEGEDLPVTPAARNFAQQIQKRFQLVVHEADERLTTKAARAEMFQQGGYRAIENSEIDAVAAKLILESWLNK